MELAKYPDSLKKGARNLLRQNSIQKYLGPEAEIDTWVKFTLRYILYRCLIRSGIHRFFWNED